MPRPLFFITSAAVLALLALAAHGHAQAPLAAFSGDNSSVTVVNLTETLMGGMTPGEEYVASIRAQARHLAYYCGSSAGVVVEAGGHRVTAGIEIERWPSWAPVRLTAHLVIYDGDRKVADRELGSVTFGQSRDWHATVRVIYHCDGRVEIYAESGGYRLSHSFEASGPLQIYASTGEQAGCSSDVHGQTYTIERCQTNTVSNPYGDPSGSQYGDRQRRDSNNDDMLLYAVAGVGALALLLALARPGGGVVVVSGRSRGMFQLLGALLLLALLGGAAAAWKLFSATHSDANTTLIAVAALGLLFLFLLVLASRRQPTVVVVEGR